VLSITAAAELSSPGGRFLLSLTG